ncbi:MAG: 4Fe-4S dicluster domain-containing protein [Nitrospirae bacterium]|nr:MAG: 4Fe-4S dicluster domain-containing protein [Nitrospirota bacterium]
MSKGHESCSGCGVCLLSCPVWHHRHTMSYTRKARAKAMQGGATHEEIALAIDACLLCGACEASCPEGIGLAALNILQRQELNRTRNDYPEWYPGELPVHKAEGTVSGRASLFLPGELLGKDTATRGAVLKQLGKNGRTTLAVDDGRDIALIIEAGLPMRPGRLESFISALNPARTLIVAEGLLHRPLRKWLPAKKIIGLGEALLSKGRLRQNLNCRDLYVIESRGYHADHKRLVLFYDRLRRETGCQTNLDLQRVAFSTGASSLQGRRDLTASGCIENAGRILKGRKIDRVIVEDLADAGAFRLAADVPVVHIGLLEQE